MGKETGMTDPGSPLFDFIRIMAILGGILLLAWTGVRSWLAPRLPGGAALRQGAVQVVARQQLDPRNTLYVVRVGEDQLLLSASDTAGVTLLREVRIETPVAEASSAQPSMSFAAALRKLQGKATNAS
jgi:flagellar biogenesis protein FliO